MIGPLRLVPRALVAATIVVVAAVGCGESPAVPEASPTLSLSLTPSSVTLEQGASTSVTAAASLDGTLTGSTTLAVVDAPTGVTGTVGAPTTNGNTTTVPVSIVVALSATPATNPITVRASSGTVSDEATLTVTVTEAVGFSLEPVSDITIEQGASGSRTVTITRTGGFAGEVSVGLVPAVAGLTMELEPTTTVGTSVALTASASESLAPGTYSFELAGTASGEPPATTGVDVTVTSPPAPSENTVHPSTIDDVLYNPGMGFTDSHFGYGYDYLDRSFISWGDYLDPPPYPDPADYPPSTVAYFRWCWSAIEPVEGQIDFERFDAILAHAAERSEGERLGFRIVAVGDHLDCMPDWLTSKPGYVGYDLDRHVPDYSNPVFLDALERLYEALGARYDGHPGMDHIDLGIVGCWGEWNTACLSTGQDLCEIMGQADPVCLETFERVIDIQMDAFPTTPRIMLGQFEGVLGAAMDHALARGAGWRVDCFGDWGLFYPDWNHHTDFYPQVVSRAGDAWQRGPVHMEVCFTMPDLYYEENMSTELVQETFDWALENHISVFNGKSTPIPVPYWPIVEDFLKKAGYRLAIVSATHPATAVPGQDILIRMSWRNLGVAPPYLPHQVAFRLRDATDAVVVQAASDADILGWLPGDHDEEDTLTIPALLESGTYALDVAILTPDGAEPAIDLAIEGRRPDGWYPLSVISVE